MQTFPHNFKKGGKYIYVMDVYDCNVILTTAMKNKIYKETIRAFASLNEDLKIQESI